MKIIELTDEESKFIAECILIAARESYWLATSDNSQNLGVDLCKRLGMDKSFCDDVEIG